MKLSLRICYFLILFFLTSCEEDFLFDTGQFTPKVTINCIFKPDAPWKVQLSFSKNAFDGEAGIEPVTDAEVYIYEKRNGREIYLSHQGEGVYTSDIYKPTQNNTYELVVYVEGYEPITAVSHIPRKARVVYVTQNIIERTIEFEIQNEETNYYLWNFMKEDNVFNLQNNEIKSPSTFVKGIVTYNNASDFIENISSTQNEAIGTGGVFSTGLNDENIQQDNPQDTVVIRKFLRILTASEDFYNFYKGYERYFANSGFHSSVSNPPVQFSNIKNGIGIFAGFTEEFKEIE